MYVNEEKHHLPHIHIRYNEFKELLIPYYEGNDDIQIKKFIKEKCYMSL